MSTSELNATQYVDSMLQGEDPDGNLSGFRLVQLLALEDIADIHNPEAWNSLMNRAGKALNNLERNMGNGNTGRILRSQWSLPAIAARTEHEIEMHPINEKIDDLDVDFLESIEHRDELTLPEIIRLNTIVYDEGLMQHCGIEDLPDRVDELMTELCAKTKNQIVIIDRLREETAEALLDDTVHWPDFIYPEDVEKLQKVQIKFGRENGTKPLFKLLLNNMIVGLQDSLGGSEREMREISHQLAVAQRIMIEPTYKNN